MVEKILEEGEELPQNWEVQGTTGYDFLAQVNNLFTNKAAVKPFEKTYREITGKKLDPNALIREKKKDILYGHMQGELNNLLALFLSLNLLNRQGNNVMPMRQRKTDFAVNYGYRDEDQITYTLPKGYKVEFIPKDVVIECEFGRYSSSAVIKDGTITYTR
ncbi:MAG: hypothetical protein EOO10_21540, partial [Chitinophagaceae bacterium]